MKESLVLVDEFGHRLGLADRSLCHQGQGIRHRAFVVFLFADDGMLLLQKRTAAKLGGDRWDVSATSHVRGDESYFMAIKRCLRHELGIRESVSPQYLLAYTYQEQMGGWAENEHCSVFTIDYQGPIQENLHEVDEIRWMTPDSLGHWFERDVSQFTQWFSEAFRRMVRHPGWG